jgi:hypothetical protein
MTASVPTRVFPLEPPLTSRGGSIYVANFAQEVVKGQLPLCVEELSGQGVEQCGRSAALVSGLHPHLSFLNHVHEINPNERVLGCLERFKPQHGPCHPLYTSMILFNGLITNDKFCLTRQSQIKLQWSRKPYRFRPRKSAYALDETSHQGA